MQPDRSSQPTRKETNDNKPRSTLDAIRADLLPSLVVFLIAIPLSLGIAQASGAPIIAGLIAGAIGGIVAGFLGGTPLQVSGPAAGLTVMVFGYVQQFGWRATLGITIIAGLIQIALGCFKIARSALAISPAVVHGMLAGIGVTIALAQLHVLLGGAPQSSAVKNMIALPNQIIEHHPPAVILGLFTLAILFGWQYLPKKIKAVPAALVAVAVSTVIAAVTRLDVKRVDLPESFQGLLQSIQFAELPKSDLWGAFAVAAISIALIASVESLLSAVATDKLHTGPKANLDRELIGQGAANTLSGLLGGLPVTGVIVRSSANINAGAKSRASAIMHGVWIVLFVALLSHLIREIPNCVLAALLVFVGIQLVKPHDIRELKHHNEASIYFATVAGVVFLNLLAGVGIGIGLAVFFLLRRLTNVSVNVEQHSAATDKTATNNGQAKWHVRIEGSLTFLSVPQLTKALSEIPPATSVDIDLMVDLMDHAAFEALHGWRQSHERAGGRVDIDERHESWYESAVDGKPRVNKSSAPLGFLGSILAGRRRNEEAQEETPDQSLDTSTLAETDPVLPDNPKPGMSPTTLVDGLLEFQRSGAADAIRPRLSQLARDGQNPSELFLTCSDSGVVPNLFTASGPGDLFKVRNIGNLVPPFQPDVQGSSASRDESVASAVEFAMQALEIDTLVVCGHSGCGAMQAALKAAREGFEALERDMPHTAAWLEYALPSVERFRRGEILDKSLPEADQLSQINVLQQLENLKTYPQVRQRLENGSLRLIGLWFDIESASVYTYDENQNLFRSVESVQAAIEAKQRAATSV
ncbi:MAG: bifunctional SulP family inorganic anion transporter/carbonic anhydrase [Armatimonadota bacterium]